ncbi:MAG: glycosyltransferase family 4 protein [Acidobacteria bacterium]|nr:glycosyltransferase family 4 protein [Acidobacteriota bacterium]
MFDFLIVTHVPHKWESGKWFAYGPYVVEMNIWLRHVGSVLILAPRSYEPVSPMESAYSSANITLIEMPQFNFLNLKNRMRSLVLLPKIFLTCFNAMRHTKHIHLRCPGNMGLVGALSQVVFRRKQKTVKFAGNWDPAAARPWSVKFQRFILRQPILMGRASVLVYGTWSDNTATCVDAFTATYSEQEITVCHPRPLDKPIRAMFIGRFNENKAPLVAVETVLQLRQMGWPISLSLVGKGPQAETLQSYAKDYPDSIKVIGELSKDQVRAHLQAAHFLLAPSSTEGWPKTVAEAMFWAVIPVVPPVSCVAQMLDSGQRGLLVPKNAQQMAQAIDTLLKDPEQYRQMALKAQSWSQQFTLEKFDSFIQQFL